VCGRILDGEQGVGEFWEGGGSTRPNENIILLIKLQTELLHMRGKKIKRQKLDSQTLK